MHNQARFVRSGSIIWLRGKYSCSPVWEFLVYVYFLMQPWKIL